MAVNKVVYGDTTLIDLTADTVTADKLSQGYTAHDKSGALITGTMTGSVSASDALLKIEAESGAAVTLSRGGVTKTPGFYIHKDTGTDYFCFIVSASEFSTAAWTATAVKGSQTVTKTVAVNQAKLYELSLSELSIVLNGTVQSGFTFLPLTSAGVNGTSTVTGGSGYVSVQLFHGQGVRLGSDIDVTPFSTLVLDTSWAGNQWLRHGLSSETGWTDRNVNDFAAMTFHEGASGYSRTTENIDISSVNGSFHFRAKAYTDSAQEYRIYNMKLMY